MSALINRLVATLATLTDRFLSGSLTGSFWVQSNDWFPAPSPTGAGTGRTGSSRGSSARGTTAHPNPVTAHRKENPMTEQQQPTIAGHVDRVTGHPASIYTPPEDLIPRVHQIVGQSTPDDTSCVARCTVCGAESVGSLPPLPCPGPGDVPSSGPARDELGPAPASGATVAALDLDACMGRAWESRDIGGVQQIVREDVPALVAEVRQSRETVAALQAECQQWADAHRNAYNYGAAAEARADAAEAALADVREVLRLRSAAHDRVITERDALAEQVAKVRAFLDDAEIWHNDRVNATHIRDNLRAALATTGEGK
jgi:hypothetical protein